MKILTFVVVVDPSLLFKQLNISDTVFAGYIFNN